MDHACRSMALSSSSLFPLSLSLWLSPYLLLAFHGKVPRRRPNANDDKVIPHCSPLFPVPVSGRDHSGNLQLTDSLPLTQALLHVTVTVPKHSRLGISSTLFLTSSLIAYTVLHRVLGRHLVLLFKCCLFTQRQQQRTLAI